MKFKKYVKDSKVITLNENFFDDNWNPDQPSMIKDEVDRVYDPVRKLIADGNFDAARAELAELEADLNALEQQNSKKKFFKFPQFMINAERARIDALKAKLPKNESLDDMDKRCEKCNTLLNDGGTCPKCDDGEEDYGDKDTVNEEMTVREKLKSAYPELNFNDNIEESIVKEELSNKEKLLRAYPELNFDNEPLTEGTGADTTHAIKDAMNQLAQKDKYSWAQTASDIVNVIPDNFADELFDAIKTKLANIKINHADKRKIVNAVGNGLSEESVEDKDTLGAILDMIDITQWANKSPQVIKGIVLVILGIVAVIEPTPIIEIIMSVIAVIPAPVVAKIAAILEVVSNPVSAAISVANKIHDKKTESLESDNLSVKEKLKRAYPELNFDTKVEEEVNSCSVPENDIDEGFIGNALGSFAGTAIANKLTEDDDSWYDDDYTVDDVEEDRRHAALYGGDRTYCNCGKKLVRTDWGSYCPDCDPETAEEEHLRMIDDDVNNEYFFGDYKKR